MRVKVYDPFDPDVCPGALEEDHTSNFDPPEHKWDEETGECNECGATK